MNRLLRLVISLYPRRWRERYEEEILELLAASRPRLGDVVDLMVWGARTRIAAARPLAFNGGAHVVLDRASAQAGRLALMGLLVLLPALTLVVLSVLKYIVGIAGPFDAVEPTVTPFITHPIGESIVIVAPYVALLLALAPTVRLELRRHDSRIAGAITFSAPAISILVAALSTATAATMAVYWIAENL